MLLVTGNASRGFQPVKIYSGFPQRFSCEEAAHPGVMD